MAAPGVEACWHCYSAAPTSCCQHLPRAPSRVRSQPPAARAAAMPRTIVGEVARARSSHRCHSQTDAASPPLPQGTSPLQTLRRGPPRCSRRQGCATPDAATACGRHIAVAGLVDVAHDALLSSIRLPSVAVSAAAAGHTTIVPALPSVAHITEPLHSHSHSHYHHRHLQCRHRRHWPPQLPAPQLPPVAGRTPACSPGPSPSTAFAARR